MQRTTVLATALAFSLGSAASAQPSDHCTRETLTVRGTAVTATYCVREVGPATAGRDLPVKVSETYATPRGSFTQDAVLRFIAGEDASRVIEDVALERLGLEGTLHLTLVLRSSQVRIDSAMLTPGAITIK